MDRAEFIELLAFNEPSFEYQGKEYSICHPQGEYYVTEEDNPQALELSFSSPDDLLDRWVIQGKCLSEILTEIHID